MFRLLPGIFDIVPLQRSDGEVNSPLQEQDRLRCGGNNVSKLTMETVIEMSTTSAGGLVSRR